MLTGDLSAIIIGNLPWWCEMSGAPQRSSIALDGQSWEEKIERMAETTIDQDVRIVAGVPSWTQVLLERILDIARVKDHLGRGLAPPATCTCMVGSAFAPYRDAFDRMMPPGIHYHRNLQRQRRVLRHPRPAWVQTTCCLMLDYGIHYEFIPFSPGSS